MLTCVELRKLAPLVPPPRPNLTRYHGVFARTAEWRARVVALAQSAWPRDDASCADAGAPTKPEAPAAEVAPRSKVRLDWAALLKRVFAVDVPADVDVLGRAASAVQQPVSRARTSLGLA